MQPVKVKQSKQENGMLILPEGDGHVFFNFATKHHVVTGECNIRQKYGVAQGVNNVAIIPDDDPDKRKLFRFDLEKFQERYLRAFSGESVDCSDIILEDYEFAVEPLPGYAIGEDVQGKGIYLGGWKPKADSAGQLSAVFDLYASPTLLSSKGLTYDHTLKAVAKLEDWHGSNGSTFDNEGELHAALSDETYHGEWFIPTVRIWREVLVKHNHTGIPKLHDIFRVNGDSHYWSSTRYGTGGSFYNVSAQSGSFSSDGRSFYNKYTCLVRAEPRR